MGTVAAIGEETRVCGFGLAGVAVLPAETPEAVRAAWDGLAGDVTLVILTRTAAAALEESSSEKLVAVLP
jgi:vacuolar-type H+-ATPase subunit F/Vma7